MPARAARRAPPRACRRSSAGSASIAARSCAICVDAPPPRGAVADRARPGAPRPRLPTRSSRSACTLFRRCRPAARSAASSRASCDGAVASARAARIGFGQLRRRALASSAARSPSLRVGSAAMRALFERDGEDAPPRRRTAPSASASPKTSRRRRRTASRARGQIGTVAAACRPARGRARDRRRSGRARQRGRACRHRRKRAWISASMRARMRVVGFLAAGGEEVFEERGAAPGVTIRSPSASTASAPSSSVPRERRGRRPQARGALMRRRAQRARSAAPRSQRRRTRRRRRTRAAARRADAPPARSATAAPTATSAASAASAMRRRRPPPPHLQPGVLQAVGVSRGRASSDSTRRSRPGRGPGSPRRGGSGSSCRGSPLPRCELQRPTRPSLASG